jgi:hypothetical protein
MIDITSYNETTKDLNIYDTQAPKAGNILSVQIGSLEYAKDLGIDMNYFLSDDFRFQNESFKSYIIEVLANRGVNVANIESVINTLFTQLNIGVSPSETSTGLIS